MFYKQTIKAKVSIERVETAVEALNVSINEFGTVNLAYMQSIYHPDISDMIKEISEKTEKTEEEINLSEQLKADFERQKMIKELEGLIFLILPAIIQTIQTPDGKLRMSTCQEM